jgi:hypothetical protein
MDVDVSYVFCFAAVGLLVCAGLLFLVRPAPSNVPSVEATTL